MGSIAERLVPRRRIGADGPEVSVLALGSWHVYDRIQFEDGVALVRRAIDAGVDFFDVGNYSEFAPPDRAPIFTDVLFGRIVQAAGVERSQYRLSQKLWLDGYPEMSFETQLDRALLRVGVEHADFSVLGSIHTEGIDIPQIVRDLALLVEKGKLGHWGVNDWSVEETRLADETAVAEGLPRPQMVQLNYSIVRRAVADSDAFRALVAETGITIEASNVLQGGLLAGKVEPTREIANSGELRERIKAVVPRLREIASDFGATPAQVAVAFCAADPATTTVLFGASRLEQLEENLGAVELLARGDELRAVVEELSLDGEAGSLSV